MKYKKYIIIIITIMLLVICSLCIACRTLYSKLEPVISETQFKNRLNSIARRYTDLYANCKILTNEYKLKLGTENIDKLSDSYLIYNMSDNERIIYFKAGNGLTKNLEPVQIYGIFESWLYIQDKQLPYDVIAVSWLYTSGGIDNTNSQLTIITKNEFENIYNSVDVSGMPIDQAARIMADKWIEKTGYEKLEG